MTIKELTRRIDSEIDAGNHDVPVRLADGREIVSIQVDKARKLVYLIPEQEKMFSPITEREFWHPGKDAA